MLASIIRLVQQGAQEYTSALQGDARIQEWLPFIPGITSYSLR
jgi:hypothetical protein